MIIYMYLTILIVVCILTGIIVTIIEKRGLYPCPQDISTKEKKEVQSISSVSKLSDSIEILEPEEIEILSDDSIEILDEEIEILSDEPYRDQIEILI